MMAEMFQTIAALMWMALSVIAFVEIRKWNKRFSDLYNHVKREFKEDEDNYGTR